MRICVIAASLLVAASGLAQGPRGCDSRLIERAGIGPIRIGQTVPAIRRLCTVVRDTVMRIDEGGPGRILFIGLGGTTVRGIVSHDTLWRLDILSPLFATSDSIRVGAPLGSLLREGVFGMAGEGDLVIFPVDRCEMSVVFNQDRDFGRPVLPLEILQSVTATLPVREVRLHACDRYRQSYLRRPT